MAKLILTITEAPCPCGQADHGIVPRIEVNYQPEQTPVESRPSSATRYAPSGASLVSAVSAAPSIARGMGTMRRF